MKTTNKSVICQGCNTKFTVDFSPKEKEKTVTHRCGKIQLVKPKK
jgi:hypothetical protein